MFKAGNWSCYKAIAIDVVTPAETFHGDYCWNKKKFRYITILKSFIFKKAIILKCEMI